jgi:tetratricopeptide (TPR) repeat protein
VTKEDALIMRGAELYDHVVNWPNPEQLAVVFAVGAALIMLATLLLSLGRLRLFARVLGILGVAAIMLAMFVIHEQTIRTKFGEYITVTRSRYPQPTRFQIRVALFGLPAAAALVMIWVANSTRRRLRATVPHHLREGRKLLAQGAHQAALAEFNSALAISPYLAEALYHRGCVHEATGQVEQALEDFDQALSCDPQHALSYLHRGRIRSERGDVDPALADFDQVMTMRPNDAECYLNRGICLARKGIISDAILDFHRVLKLTNHSDYAEPARFYLNQLGSENSTPSPLPSANGSDHAAGSTAIQPTGQDYVL